MENSVAKTSNRADFFFCKPAVFAFLAGVCEQNKAKTLCIMFYISDSDKIHGFTLSNCLRSSRRLATCCWYFTLSPFNSSIPFRGRERVISSYEILTHSGTHTSDDFPAAANTEPMVLKRA